MLLFTLLNFSYAGTIWPGSISNTIANRNEYSDYTFVVIPETNVPVGGYIEIIFPIQYQAGLGGQAYCTNCSINLHSVQFYYYDDPILSVSNTLTLYNVLNPSERGGTGNFIIRTKRYGFVYDENLIFSTIGIADDISLLSSCIVAYVDEPTAGSLGKYNFAFKTNIILPYGTTIQLFIPTVYTVSDNPSCSLYSINDLEIEGDIVCTKLDGNKIQVSGFANDIQSGSEVGIQVSITNPTYSQITDTFTIAAYRYGTSIIYSWKTGISGIQILPGLISEISLTPLQDVRLVTGKIVDYQLEFLPTNPLPEGGAIRIMFPTTFLLETTVPFLFFKSGLSDISETSPLVISLDSTNNQIVITNFQATTPELIILQFRAINPSSSGPSTALDIQTCTDDTFANIIDEDKETATITVVSGASLSFFPVSLSPSTSQQTSTDLTFTIIPSTAISGGAYIKILLDAAFYVGTVKASNCISYVSTSTQSIMCNKTDNLITWQNPSTISYSVNLASQFQITGLIQTPTYSGTYTCDIELFDSSGNLLQSYTNYMIVQPLGLLNPTMEFIGPEQSIIGTPRYSIFITTFYNQIIVPQGGYDSTKQTAQGRIKFQFPSASVYDDNQLGTTYGDGDQIPCKAVKGLLPMDGLSIQCNLYHASGTTGAYIIMRNFKEIPYQSNIEIHIPKLQNPLSASEVITVLIYQKQYGQDVSLNIFSNTFGFRTQYSLNPGTSVSATTISNLKLSGIFNVSMDLVPGTDFTDGSDLIVKLPGYDTMFIPQEEVVVCYIDTYLQPCYQYYGVDWLLMRIKSPEVHYYTANPKPKLYVYNLNWPRYSDSVDYVYWVLLQDPFSSGQNYEVEARKLYYNSGTNTFQAPDVNDFDVAQILSPQKGEGYVGLNFEFYFITSYLIPDGSSFILTFPTDFSLDGSYPQASFSAPQFYSVSDNLPLLFQASGNILTITNIKEHPASGPFTILVQGVKSSKSPSTSQAKPFLAEIRLNGKLIVKTQDTINGFDYFDYGALFVPGKVIFNSITAFPNNQLENATYTFTFTLTNQVPVGGQISITYPEGYYTSLPIPDIDCRCNVTGALTSYKSCKLWQNTYIIITDSAYESGEIVFILDNVLNPLTGYATPFTIDSKYDGEYLDISDDGLLESRQLYISPKSESVLVQSIDFAPRNEGEQATYIFEFVPSTYISSSYVVIQFPRNYDSRIGDSIVCKPYDCTVTNRQIWISGITDYQPLGSNPIQISITGVVNPNQNQNNQWIGYFSIGVINENAYNYIDYNSKAGILEIVAAPGWAYLYNVIPANLYSRWESTSYMFNLTTSQIVPKESSEGSIIVDFPTQFDITDETKTCVIYDSDFATTLTCSSSTNSITVQGNTEDFSGVITFNITNVQNPPDETTIDQIIVKTYDGFKKKIIEKSYKNLDPWTFSYTYPGPLITINNDEVITVERGTQTQDLWFKVVYPCALDLVFTPSSQLTIIPSQIKLSLTDLQQKFRVSASESLTPGTYTISWSVTGELTTPYYTPVKKSTVKVTNNKNIRVTVPTVNDIPQDGNSLDSYITVDYAPDLGFEVLITASNSAITLDKRSIQFIAGQNNATFRVACNKTLYEELDSPTSYINLVLSGINKDVYLLTSTQVEITITSKDTEAPFITGLSNDSTTQTQTKIIVSVGEISVIYYMIALYGTTSPESTELLNLGPATYNTTRSIYGKVSIGKSNTATVQILNLRAQTPYVVYAIAEDRGSLYSDIKSLTFWTLNRYNASSTTLTFTQSYLNQAERDNIMVYVAFVLSLPSNKVVEKTSFTTQTSRILDSSSTTLSIYIISIPTTENFPSPYNLITILNNRLSYLSTLISNLDTTNTLTATDYIPQYPTFISTPTQVSSNYTACIVQGTLDQVGELFVISIEAALATSSPLAVQIWWGYNSFNIPMPDTWIQVTEANTAYNLTIVNLTDDTDYNIYMVAGSSHPGYPDLSSDESDVHLISCKTEAYLPSTRLDINKALILEIIMSVLIILI